MSERRYYGTGRKKYTSRRERMKEVPRFRHNHDSIGSDEVFVSEMPRQDDDICEANDVIVWGEKKNNNQIVIFPKCLVNVF